MIQDEGEKERLSGESPREARGPLLPLTEVSEQSQKPKVTVHSAVYVTYDGSEDLEPLGLLLILFVELG
jgi:hypothetical protein